MLSESDKTVIIRCAQKYNVSAIYLFGSSLDADAQSCDIDLGVEGVNPVMFFKFYGELSRHLSKSVDLADLKKQGVVKIKKATIFSPPSSSVVKQQLFFARRRFNLGQQLLQLSL